MNNSKGRKLNERIKELMWDAGLNSNYVEGFDSIYSEQLEKFAELIVRECVDLCEHESNDDEYDQYDMGMSVKAEDIKASIMKTFGVK